MTLGKWVKKTRDSQQEQIPPDAELTGSERLELIRLSGCAPNSRTRRPRSPSCRCRWSLQKSGDLVRERQAVKFAAIADWADSNSYPVAFMCVELGVSRSGYYAWLTAAPSQRSKDDTTLIAIMKKLHAEARGNPGVRRLHAGLAALGHRLIPTDGRAFPRLRMASAQASDLHEAPDTLARQPVPAPDLIGRSFCAERPNEKWCGDITYVKTWDGWAYVATVIDLYSRKLVGWAIADHMRTELVTAALDMAIANRRRE